MPEKRDRQPPCCSLLSGNCREQLPDHPFLQTEQPQFLQQLLITLIFQSLHQLHWTSLHTLDQLHVLLEVRGPNLKAALKVQSHRCCIWRDNHVSCAAGHTTSDVGQDGIDLLGLWPMVETPQFLHKPITGSHLSVGLRRMIRWREKLRRMHTPGSASSCAFPSAPHSLRYQREDEGLCWEQASCQHCNREVGSGQQRN